MDNFLEFLGRLHPMLVHFPIALILTGGAIELLRGGKDKPSEAGVTCLLLGSLAAFAAAGAGWLHAEHVDVGAAMEDILFRHRWVGVGVAGVSLITGLVAWRMRAAESSSLGPVFRTGVILSMSLVAYDGHLGGTLVFGDGYLMDVLMRPSQDEAPVSVPQDPIPGPGPEDLAQGDPTQGNPSQGDSGTTTVERIPEPGADTQPPTPTGGVGDGIPADPSSVADTGGVSYTREVLPIFEARCYKCHGPTGKARGGLRMHDIPALHEGPEELWVLHPGSAEKSLLYQLLTLPADDLDIMPASGDPLTADQIDIIKRWIDEGAKVDEGGGSGGPAGSDAKGASGATDAKGADERVGQTGHEDPASVPTESEELSFTNPDTTTEPESSKTGASEAASAVVLDEAARGRRDQALEGLRALGAHAARVAQDTDEVEVHFGLMGKRVTDETLASLAGLEPCLVSLDLSRSQLTDAGLAGLAPFTHLRRLRLDQTGIGDAGVKELAALKQLEVLNLFGTKVGDDGLGSVAKLPRLARVFVWQSAVTPEGIARLQETRPELQVVGGEEPESEEEVDEGEDDA